MRAEASYLPRTAEREPMMFTPQSSQRARGAEVWAVLAALGRDGVSRLVAGHAALARRFASGLVAGGLRVLNEVRLNQVVVACANPAATDEMITALQREGTCWCGPTTWRGRRGMRISVSNWATTESDVDRSVAAILAAAQRTGTLG
jgi:glutamate/tyrosine decarboxylase-like PLP-dependent enzyme